MEEIEPEPYDWTCPMCGCPNQEEDAPEYGKLLTCRVCGGTSHAYMEEE